MQEFVLTSTVPTLIREGNKLVHRITECLQFAEATVSPLHIT